MIRFGIIGFGFMGHKHAAALATFDWAEVVAVCDINPTVLSDAPCSAQTYTDAIDLLKNPDVDVVIISANNNQHMKLIKMAAEAKKDILCEKPVCMSVAELDEAIAVVEKHGVKFTVHQQRRLDKNYQTAKAVYERELLGHVYFIKSALYGFNGNMHDWHIYKTEGGGMLYDWGAHLLDQALYMVDSEVETVYADVRNVINFEVDDYFKIQLKFKNGVSMEIELGNYFLNETPEWFGQHFIVCGNEGTAHINGFNGLGKIVRTTALLESVSNVETASAAGPTRSFGRKPEGIVFTEPLPEVKSGQMDYYRNFYKAYCGEEEFLVKIPQVRRALMLMEAVRESARIGQSVHFE